MFSMYLVETDDQVIGLKTETRESPRNGVLRLFPLHTIALDLSQFNFISIVKPILAL